MSNISRTNLDALPDVTIRDMERRIMHASDKQCILLDTSSSMNELCGETNKMKLMRDALVSMNLSPETAINSKDGVVVIGFGAHQTTIMTAFPENLIGRGGTPMHLAIEAARVYSPIKTLIVSDGRPDNENLTLDAAKILTGQINTIYIGPETDLHAIEFMRKLSVIGYGKSVSFDVVKDGMISANTGQAIRHVMKALTNKPRG